MLLRYVITVNIYMTWGFDFILKWELFLFTGSLKTKNCFCKEMRFFLKQQNALLTQ